MSDAGTESRGALRAGWWARGLTVAVAAGLLAGGCLDESVPPEGSPARGPGFAPSGQPQQPGLGGPPAPGGQPSGWDAPCVGLYSGYKKPYVFIWPDDKFNMGKPAFRPDGSFDYQATIAKLEPSKYGTVSASPDPANDRKFKTVFSYADGSTRNAVLTVNKSGLCHLSNYDVYQVGRPTFSEIDGRFARDFSITVGDAGNPTPGQVGTDLTVSITSILTFMPGRRFHFKRTGFVSTYSTIGTGGGSVGNDASFVEDKNVDAGGTYEIKGHFLTLTFDQGAKVFDIFEYLEPVHVKDDYWTNAYLKYGGYTYSCGKCTVR